MRVADVKARPRCFAMARSSVRKIALNRQVISLLRTVRAVVPVYAEDLNSILLLLAEWYTKDRTNRIVDIRCSQRYPLPITDWVVKLSETTWELAAVGRNENLAKAACEAYLRARGFWKDTPL